MKKRISEGFGKKVYLLGTYYGRYVWLEAPSWDCGWYWGFGYVEEYTNHKNPTKARDIAMHTHWDSIHKEKGNPFDEMTVTAEEYEELKQLFKDWYKLKKLAQICHHVDNGSTYHINRIPEEFKDLPMSQFYGKSKQLNEVQMPAIHNRIIEILTP